MSMARSRLHLAPIIRITSIYKSRQFLAYVACGSMAALSQIGTRCAANLVMPFAAAVVLSYVIGMFVALVLYRRFVFSVNDRPIKRQVALFAMSYVLLFPLSFGVSVGAAALLSFVLAPVDARMLGHTVGVGLPVFINFAFNKFVTFRGAVQTHAS